MEGMAPRWRYLGPTSRLESLLHQAAAAALDDLTRPDLLAIDVTALQAAIEHALVVGAGVAAETAATRLSHAERAQARVALESKVRRLCAPEADALSVDRAALKAAIEQARGVGLDMQVAETRLTEAEAAHSRAHKRTEIAESLGSLLAVDDAYDATGVNVANSPAVPAAPMYPPEGLSPRLRSSRAFRRGG